MDRLAEIWFSSLLGYLLGNLSETRQSAISKEHVCSGKSVISSTCSGKSVISSTVESLCKY